MRTLLQEEIFRIKEIMGITPKNLIYEAGGGALPYKDFLRSIFMGINIGLYDGLMSQIASRAVLNDADLAKLADEIFINPSGSMSYYMADVLESMRKLSNQFDSFDNKELLELVLRGENDNDIKRALANSLMDVEARSIAEFGGSTSFSIKNFIDENSANIDVAVHLDNMTSLRTTFDDAVREGKDPEIILSRMKEFIEQQNYPEAVKQYYEEFLGGLGSKYKKSETTTTADINSFINSIRVSEADIARSRTVVDDKTKPLQGAVADYLASKFKVLNFESWKRLTVEEQNRIITEMSTKINTTFEATIRENGFTANLDSANAIVKAAMEGGYISLEEINKIYKDTLEKTKPSFGFLGNVLDGLVEYTTGISARQGEIFWTTTTGWGVVTKRWFLFNAAWVLGEGLYRAYNTREEPTSDDWLEILEQRIDLTGLAQRLLLPLPLIPRFIASEVIQAGVKKGFDYSGFRKLTEGEITKQFGATNVEKKDVTQFPCYDKIDSLKQFTERANYFIVNGKNQGVWAYNLQDGKPAQINTPYKDDCSGPVGGDIPNIQTETKYPNTLDGFKAWYIAEKTQDADMSGAIQKDDKYYTSGDATKYYTYQDPNTVKDDKERFKKN